MSKTKSRYKDGAKTVLVHLEPVAHEKLKFTADQNNESMSYTAHVLLTDALMGEKKMEVVDVDASLSSMLGDDDNTDFIRDKLGITPTPEPSVEPVQEKVEEEKPVLTDDEKWRQGVLDACSVLKNMYQFQVRTSSGITLGEDLEIRILRELGLQGE